MKPMEVGSVFAFINFKQAAQFGHIGWGFQLADDSFYFGSADHLWKHDWWDLVAWLRYMHVPPGGDIDWWAEQGSKAEMLRVMKTGLSSQSGRHIYYHAYKEVSLNDISPDSAMRVVEDLRGAGWHISKHNCVQHAYLIFSNYSKQNKLPNPFADPLNLIPKTWFARLSGIEQDL